MTDQILSLRNEDELQQSIGMDEEEIKRNITIEEIE